MNNGYQAVVFDMDGTILNTLEDLTDSLNRALEETGHRHNYLPAEVRLFFGSGARTAIMRALAMEAGEAPAGLLKIEAAVDTSQPFKAGATDDPGRLLSPGTPQSAAEAKCSRILERFRPHYEMHCRDHTAPYPGIKELLKALRAKGILTAVASNKPDEAVQILVRDQFPDLFDFAIGEQPGIRRKPAPDMTLLALCHLAGVSEPDALPECFLKRALYVGDSEIDLQTAERTGLDCAAVTWGFRPREDLARLHPAFIADTCGALYEIILDKSREAS